MNKQQTNNSFQRILVVDDNADILRLNVKVLAAAGYQVDTAEDGAAAWDALQCNRYDLLITDNEMPKLSGIELLENLLVAHIWLPVIMVSGKMPSDALNQHPWLQVEATLLKPYTITDFLGTVGAVLGAASANLEQKQIDLRHLCDTNHQPFGMENTRKGKTLAEYWHASHK